MTRVAPINLTFNPRTLWFDPVDLEIHKDDPVLVQTARGTEFGHAASDIIDVSEQDIESLRSPLKPVLRIATEDDVQKASRLEQKSRDAMEVFRDMVLEGQEEMHPVSVEFLFDEDKAVFYFEAEERVDFRDLVRRLAARFHIRIDMRQIGVRDEARIVGGLGHCGQELCCKRLGGEFCPVSIRMAKEQDLSLNPQKISGLCGRLMCCLRYEYEAYRDFKSRAPKVNAVIQTPAGPARVSELNVPREVITLKCEDEKTVNVPLAHFDPPAEGERPSVVGQEAWDEATAERISGYRSDTMTFLTSQFTGKDKLADATRVRHVPGGKASSGSSETTKEKSSTRRVRRQRHKSTDHAEPATTSRKPRRRSTKLKTADDGARSTETVKSDHRDESASKPKRRSRNRSHGPNANAPRERTSNQAATPKGEGPRPGQRSSGLRNPSRSTSSSKSGKGGRNAQPVNETSHRRTRHRSHTAGNQKKSE